MTLRHRILLGLLGSTFVPLGGAVLIVQRSLTRPVEDSAGREMHSLVQNTADALNVYMRQRQSDLRLLASNPTIATGTPTTIARRLDQLSRLNSTFDGLYIADREGRVVAAARSAPVASGSDGVAESTSSSSRRSWTVRAGRKACWSACWARAAFNRSSPISPIARSAMRRLFCWRPTAAC